MVRTRVGYAGGAKENPTYHDLGDHTETLEIDFDPAVISYEKIMDLFWTAHNPCAESWSRQYMSAVFVRDEEQRRIATEVRDRVAKDLKDPVTTPILPLARFWIAEDYHQKYRLRHDRLLMRELKAYYPDDRDFVNSTVAARLNGRLDGEGDPAVLDREIGSYGLSEDGRARLRAVMK